MRLRLTPGNTSFYDHFTAAAVNLVEGAHLLREIFAEGADRPLLAKKLRDVEHRSDEITHAVMRQLNSTFITPFDREDIYRLAVRLDDVVDYMDAAVDLTTLYNPEALPDNVRMQAEILDKCATLTADAMGRLASLRNLTDFWVQINELENEADQVYRRLLQYLFNGSHDPLTVMKLKEIVDQLESAADAFEHVADVVHSIAVKES